MVERFVGEEEVNEMWAEHIGSHLLSEWDEILALRRLAESRIFPRYTVMRLYLQSKRWKVLRALVLRRDVYRCVKCGDTFRLNVDHLRYPKQIGDERLEDLQTLCFHCHEEKTVWHNLQERKFSKKPVQLKGKQLFSVIGGKHG